MQLEQVVERIEQAFGEELPFSDSALNGEDRDVLKRVFGDQGYQAYLQDQVSRQIIRDYLINAVLLGFVAEDGLSRLAERMDSPERRAALALYMLMSAVEQAGELLSGDDPGLLERLQPKRGTRPLMKLVQTD